MVQVGWSKMKLKLIISFTLTALISIHVSTVSLFAFGDKVKIYIDSAVLDKDKLVVKYEIQNFSNDYMEMIMPKHFRSSRGQGISWNLPFRTEDSENTRLNLFTDVAHCAPPSEAPVSLVYGVKQLKQGSHSEKFVLQTPIKENFPFFKKGKIEKFWVPVYGFWDIVKFWELMQTSIDLDERNYLELERNWVNFIDVDKVQKIETGNSRFIDMEKVKSIKLTIGIIGDYGLRIGKEPEFMSMCGQTMKKHMFYVTAEKEITRAN